MSPDSFSFIYILPQIACDAYFCFRVVLLLFVSVVLAATIYEYTLSHMSQKGNEDNEILYTDALNATLYKTGKYMYNCDYI